MGTIQSFFNKENMLEKNNTNELQKLVWYFDEEKEKSRQNKGFSKIIRKYLWFYNHE